VSPGNKMHENRTITDTKYHSKYSLSLPLFELFLPFFEAHNGLPHPSALPYNGVLSQHDRNHSLMVLLKGLPLIHPSCEEEILLSQPHSEHPQNHLQYVFLSSESSQDFLFQ